MEQENDSVQKMWENYLTYIGENINTSKKKYTSWYFCDNKNSADTLAYLTKSGVKRATTSLNYSYEVEGEALPQMGEFSIITDWEGFAQCIIETTKISVVPFREVTKEFAKLEGEGDKSLKYWRKVHISFFTRELNEHKLEFSEEMFVICEEFEKVF